MFEDVEAPGPMKAIFAVLFALGSGGPSGLTVRELAHRTSLQERVIYRHLATLKALGLAEPSEASGRFRTGRAAVSLSDAARSQKDFLGHAQAAVDRLTEDIGEPVHVTVYDHGTSATVVAASDAVVRTSQVVPVVVGSRRPAHGSASGKLFLAHSQPAREAYLLRPLTAFTQHTIVDPKAFRAECEDIRERGYSTEVQENLLGVSCVAVPVSSVPGRVSAALVVSTAQPALEPHREQSLVSALSAAAESLSRRLGGMA